MQRAREGEREGATTLPPVWRVFTSIPFVLIYLALAKQLSEFSSGGDVSVCRTVTVANRRRRHTHQMSTVLSTGQRPPLSLRPAPVSAVRQVGR